jgi:hypothetical protein
MTLGDEVPDRLEEPDFQARVFPLFDDRMDDIA